MAILTLDKTEKGDRLKVSHIAIKGSIGRRLMDMGITKGSEIQVMGKAPLGDPIAIKIRGYNLTLRKQEASEITVEVI